MKLYSSFRKVAITGGTSTEKEAAVYGGFYTARGRDIDL